MKSHSIVYIVSEDEKALQMISFPIDSCVFWEETGVGIWSGTVKDRYMLGGLCITVQIDGVVVPVDLATPAKAWTNWKGPGKFECYITAVPASQLKVRQPNADDAEKRNVWESAMASTAEAAGVPARQKAETVALQLLQ